MTLLTNSGFQTAAAAPVYGELALVELQLRSGTARYTTWPVTLDALGQTWQGTGNLGSIGALHESEDGADIEEIEKKIKLAKMPKDALKKAEGELKKLKLMSPMSAEATVVRNYIDVLIGLPWSKPRKPRAPRWPTCAPTTGWITSSSSTRRCAS